MKSMNRTILGLVASVVMVGALSLLGCASDDEEGGFRDLTLADVDGQCFTFTNGAVFHPDLAGDAVRLCFDGTRFTLEELGTGRIARGIFTVGPPCTAIVTSSNFPEGTGPQEGDGQEFPTCQFNPDNDIIRLINLGGIEGLSAPGIPTGTGGSGG